MAKAQKTMQQDGSLVLHMSRRFDAPREDVFRAWTDPEAVAQWMGPPGVQARDVKIDLRIDGGYSLVMDGEDGGVYPLSGIYREIASPSRLVFTFIWGHGELEGHEMLVTLDFADDGAGTLLTLTQEKVPSETARGHHEQGWTGSLDRLADYLAR